MESVLFLCHRIPYPPNKGDKITTYNIVKYLSSRYQLYVGCFLDEPFDEQYIEPLKSLCTELKVVDISSKSQLNSGISALLVNEPVSTRHYTNQTLQDWVDAVIKDNNLNRLIAYSGGMAQFIESEQYQTCNRILDMADVDSDKWRQYAENKSVLSAWVYKREQKLLQRYEQKLLAEFNAITLITDEERDLFKSMSPPKHQDKIVTLSNGVDTEYFDPTAHFDFTDSPDKQHQEFICFTGAMDYWANVDAVVWFVQHVWPLLKQAKPDLVFYIVGGKPTAAVLKLASEDIVITGRVADVRPFVSGAKVCVASLRIARGVQNKVLEAMSMAKPVVMTSMAQEGIELPSTQSDYVQDSPKLMAHEIIKLLNDQVLAVSVGNSNRHWISERYSWSGALSKLNDLIDDGVRNDS